MHPEFRQREAADDDSDVKVPTEPEPDLATLEHWVFDGVAEATDGCTVEPDGHCPHGYPSWLLHLGYV